MGAKVKKLNIGGDNKTELLEFKQLQFLQAFIDNYMKQFSNTKFKAVDWSLCIVASESEDRKKDISEYHQLSNATNIHHAQEMFYVAYEVCSTIEDELETVEDTNEINYLYHHVNISARAVPNEDDEEETILPN